MAAVEAPYRESASATPVAPMAPLTSVTPRPRRPTSLWSARARLERLGAHALSDLELVALITGLDSEVGAAALLRDGLTALLSAPPDVLAATPGLSPSAAIALIVAAELARRLPLRDDSRQTLSTPEAIYAFARPLLVGLRREEFHVLCLSSRNVLLRHVRVAEGSVDCCHVDPREVLAPAIACRATAVVVFHNHPSGDPEPSVLDVALTRQLRDGARLVCVRLIDHLIVGAQGFVSLLQRGLLEPRSELSPPKVQRRP
jgi:DNA repair protein RadC